MIRRLGLAAAALGLVAAVVPAMVSPAAATAGHRAVPAIHLSAADAVMTGVTNPATGSLYTFDSLVDGRPIRWNPCAPIHWQFRAPGAPTGGLTVVKQVVARVAQTTGTTWVFDGTVGTAPTTAWLPTTTTSVRPVLIGWADATSSDLLRNQPRGVLGVTRTAWMGVRKDGHSYAVIRAAVIALDRSDRLPLNGPVSWRTVALHEMSHAMGLDHAGSSRQLMYPVLQPGLADLQSGDLQGLARVGRSAGCVVLPS